MPRRITEDEPITDKLVKGLERPEKGSRIWYDGGPKRISGFGIRATAGGSKAFVLTYRNKEGRDRRLTIGTYSPNEWSVAAARKRAGELKRLIDTGADPLEEQVEARKAPTIADLCDRYISDHLPRKRESSAREDKAMIRNIIKPKLGRRKVKAVTHAEVDKLHRDLRPTPYRANRTLALLSKMFSLAAKWGWRADNPAKGVERYTEEKRTRYLSVQEFKQLTEALAGYPKTATRPDWAAKVANVVRLLLLTGARSGEVLKAEWSQFDLEKGEWIKPGSTTKQKTAHIVPLSAPAVTLLQGIHETAEKGEDGKPISAYVFPGRGPDAPIAEFKDEWAAIREAAGIPDVRVHDLRHSFASVLASKGASLPMIGALLGHSNPATTARYAHLFSDPLRTLADEVGHVVTGTKSAEVVEMRKNGAA